VSFRPWKSAFKEFFDVAIADNEFLMFKSLMATTYRTTCNSLMKKMIVGEVLLIDETEVKLRTGKGYVWVFSSLEETVYLYKPTREGDFLREMLKDFHGVLVSRPAHIKHAIVKELASGSRY
jgi:hypothetical protein